VQLELSAWSPQLVSLMAGAHAVIHLAAVNPFPDASWAECAQSCDIHALVVEGAVRARVRRLILASSSHVLGNHWRDGSCALLLPDAPLLTSASELRPGTQFNLLPLAQMDAMPYSVAKLCAERLGACAAQHSAMEVVVVRIGWCQPGANLPSTLSATGTPKLGAGDTFAATGEGDVRPAAAAEVGGAAELEQRRAEIELWFRNMWLSNRDLVQLFEATVVAVLDGQGTGVPFVVVNGMSSNRGSRWSKENAIGYLALDDVHARPAA